MGGLLRKLGIFSRGKVTGQGEDKNLWFQSKQLQPLQLHKKTNEEENDLISLRHLPGKKWWKVTIKKKIGK